MDYIRVPHLPFNDYKQLITRTKNLGALCALPHLNILGYLIPPFNRFHSLLHTYLKLTRSSDLLFSWPSVRRHRALLSKQKLTLIMKKEQFAATTDPSSSLDFSRSLAS
ncbi:hypothetical protein AVEN_86372-1 [Araneus ventricosus]|uniref:Uncharacterized protein n=1 Tax=Araneus ventricosus TaxID=182803 RepID=A0A4Y2SHT5_ARAVE|nr:hypothetical protein AVEN_86372-1 [Araneus ventricosus]